MLRPFQDCRKAYYQNKSDRNALFSRVMKYILSSLAAVEYILETKALPGCTTLVACWRVPTSDRICLFLAFFLGSHIFNNSWILASLSDGIALSPCGLCPKLYPGRLAMLKGPLVCRLLGIPLIQHIRMQMFTLCWHTVEAGGPIVR